MLGCGGSQGVPTATGDWDLPDPKGQTLDAVRETRVEIERRVAQLLAELEI